MKARKEGTGPEIDAREKAINEFQSVRFQTCKVGLVLEKR